MSFQEDKADQEKKAKREDQLKKLEKHLNSVNQKLKENITKKQKIKIFWGKDNLIFFCFVIVK